MAKDRLESFCAGLKDVCSDFLDVLPFVVMLIVGSLALLVVMFVCMMLDMCAW